MDPKSLKYAPSHEWVKVDGDVATVGISRFAVDQLTDLILIDLAKARPGVTLTAELTNIIEAAFTFQGTGTLTMTPAPGTP